MIYGSFILKTMWIGYLQATVLSDYCQVTMEKLNYYRLPQVILDLDRRNGYFSKRVGKKYNAFFLLNPGFQSFVLARVNLRSP